MSKIEAFFSAFLDTALLLTPVLICLTLLLTFNVQDMSGKRIDIENLSEWSFASTFLYITLVRDYSQLWRKRPGPSSHILTAMLCSLAVLSLSLMGFQYIVSASLIAAPKSQFILTTLQFVLLVGGLLFHLLLRYRELAVDVGENA